MVLVTVIIVVTHNLAMAAIEAVNNPKKLVR